MKNQLDYYILEIINNAIKTVKASPLILGATSSGAGGPVGGYVGYLPQTRVSYDQAELAMSGFMEPGAYNEELGIIVSGSLIDNLNHIRWRIQNLEAGSGGGGASSFLELNDTPDSYAGFAGYVLAVNGTEDAIEFVVSSGGGGTPAGSDREVQFNNAGAFGADTEFIYQDDVKGLGIGDFDLMPFTTDRSMWMVGDGQSPTHFGLAYGATKAPFIGLAKADGSGTTPANVKEDQVIGRVRGYGFDGTDWSGTQSEIRIVADGDWSGSSHPTRIELWSTPVGSTTLTLVATIGSDGHLSLASGKQFRVNGSQHLHDAADIVSGTLDDTLLPTPSTTTLGGVKRNMGSAGQYVTGIDASGNLEYDTPAGGGATDGWIEISESWSYASASTITIPSDGTTKYRKYMKIRFKQGGGYKYFVSSAITATLLTVIVNNDYVVANTAITDIAISFEDVPFGFPSEFAYTPSSWLNISVGNASVNLGHYKIVGSTLICRIALQWGTTTSITGTGIGAAIPTGLSASSAYQITNHMVGIARFVIGGTPYQGTIVMSAGATIASMTTLAGGSYITNTSVTSSVPATWNSSSNIEMQFYVMLN